MRGLARHAANPPSRADADERLLLLAGASAMSAFVLLGAATTSGWLDARLGLIGSVGAAVIHLAVLAHAHLEARSR